ncbi:MAG: hypothetical protein L3J71_10555 [Victivallaceae bacterium]|nr:hypothetical protein [Victivallaceae bacterium]
MKKIIFILLFACIISGANTLWANVALRVELNRKNYLQYETVYAKLIMRNDSGHVLAFGANEKLRGSVTFEISDEFNNVVKRRKNQQIDIIGTIIKPGETKKMIINLGKYYQTMPTGKYSIIAYIKHAQLPLEYQSNRGHFNITQGHNVWSRTVGIPEFVKINKNQKINSRTYKLKTMFDGTDEIIFLTVEDERRVYAVRKVGYTIGESPPKCEIDLLSRLHLLLPVSAKVFSYFIFDINGKLEKREVYKRTSTIPMLVRNHKNGIVVVAGGALARKHLDYRDDEE